MRKPIPIRVSNDVKVFARYQGVIDAHVLVSSGALMVFTQRELDAIVMHEMGHYQRWHVEIKLGYAAAICLLALSVNGLIGFFALALPLLGLLLELDADAYAARAGHSMRAVIERMLELRFSALGRLQLKLRLAMLK